jgi:Domain of unknown function (DUF1844)
MAEEDEKRGFRVEDRRRFSAEGQLRPEHHHADEPAQSEARAADEPARAETAHAAESRGAAHGAGARLGGGEPEINFATFMVGLSTEALAALGEMPDPATGTSRRDLRAAQQLIDIIGMLREKTRGNLDHDEENLVDAILFDLRMKYVELARTPGH